MTVTALRPILCVAAIALGLLVAPASAEGTAQQRAACTPDVMRLCASEIPSVDRIIACMRRERAKLSPACQQAMGPAPAVTVAANASPRQTVR